MERMFWTDQVWTSRAWMNWLVMGVLAGVAVGSGSAIAQPSPLEITNTFPSSAAQAAAKTVVESSPESRILGDRIFVTSLEDVVFYPDRAAEQRALFRLAEPIVGAQGQVLVAAGADVEAVLILGEAGVQIVAEALVVRGVSLPLRARSFQRLPLERRVVRDGVAKAREAQGLLGPVGAGLSYAVGAGDGRALQTGQIFTGIAAGLYGWIVGPDVEERVVVGAGQRFMLQLEEPLVLQSASRRLGETW